MDSGNCFVCDQPGHRANECPKKTRERPSAGAWSLGLLGELDRSFPRQPLPFNYVRACLRGYCGGCCLYGSTAKKVHGGSCLKHAIKYNLYAVLCACGLVAGPTRRAIREAYSLPVAPEEMKAAGECADCLTHTVPCVAVFAGCQDARELEARGVSDAVPVKPAEFSWKPTPLAMAR